MKLFQIVILVFFFGFCACHKQVEKVCPSNEDKDNDGVETKVDCDDNDPLIGYEFKNCQSVKKNTNKIVIVANIGGLQYSLFTKETFSAADFKNGEWTDKTYFGTTTTFDDYAEVEIKGGCAFEFNMGIYSGCAPKFCAPQGFLISSACVVAWNMMPKVYEIRDGKLKNMTGFLLANCTVKFNSMYSLVLNMYPSGNGMCSK